MTSHTRLCFGDDARARVLTGATALADAIRITLGPRSRSVLIGARWGTPTVCDDGVTIARQLHLKEPEEDLGVQMLRQAAVRTDDAVGDAVGDGTSTSAVLAHALFADGLRNVVAGASATELRRGMTLASAAVSDALRGMARPVSSRSEKVQVATVSAHGDATLGESWATRCIVSAATESSPSKKRGRPRRTSRSSRGCASIGAVCRPIS